MKTKKEKITTLIIWILIISQMAAWLYLMYNGGKTNDKEYVIFSIGMLLGQAGASIDCIKQKAWPTLAVQIFFFITTIFGLLQRFIIKKTSD